MTPVLILSAALAVGLFGLIMAEDERRAWAWRQTVLRWHGFMGGPVDRERIRWICKARRVAANYNNKVTWNPTLEGEMNDALAKWSYLPDEEKELAFCEAQAFLVRTKFNTSA